MQAISFVHSSQELFQLALKIVKAKQKLYEQEQQVVQSDLPPPYASIVSGKPLLHEVNCLCMHAEKEA